MNLSMLFKQLMCSHCCVTYKQVEPKCKHGTLLGKVHLQVCIDCEKVLASGVELTGSAQHDSDFRIVHGRYK